MTAGKPLVWGIGTTRTVRAHWMLREFGVDYETRPIRSRTGETYTDEFLALNPKHKIPVLQHGSVVLSESAAIATYVSETFDPPAGFYVPANPAERGRLNEWCYFVISELDAHTLYVIRRHDGLKEIYGEAPVAVESAREYFLDQMNAMAGRVEAAGKYLFGDDLSVADVLLMTCLDWARLYHIPLPDILAAYQARVDDRPAYREAFEFNFPGLDIRKAR
ncbi:MAG: glutathione S-transferase family protein [Minwuiales bacterium]|nr:glutathione S-transferase family protein [Minwuiales bacterium]